MEAVSCGDKIRHRTFYAAMQRIKSLGRGKKRRGDDIAGKLAPYRCSYCNGWHIGHYLRD